MDKLVMKFAGSLIGNHIKGDDFVDRLYYHVTAAAFLLLAAGSGYMLYGGDPIECSLGNPSTASTNGNVRNTGTSSSSSQNQDGINAYCLARQLQRPPESSGDDGDAFVMDFGTAFFKWAPLVFVFQAFIFKVPNMLWNRLIASSTKELETVRNLIEEAMTLKDERERRLRMDKVVVYFETWVTGYITHDKLWVRRLQAVFFCFAKHNGSYLSSLYISMKILNFLVLFVCAFLLIGFFDGEFFKYGLTALDKIYSDGDWEDSVNFPKMLICEYFVVKGPNQVAGSTVSQTPASVISREMQHAQCAMSINFFLEKVFLLEWFWFILLGCVTIFNICMWMCKIKQPFITFFFVKDYMETINSFPEKEDGATSSESEDSLSSEQEESLQDSFVSDYLRSDGVFLLRLLEVNSGRAIVGELVFSLYRRFKKIHGYKITNLDLHPNSGSSDDSNNKKGKNSNKKYSQFWKNIALGKIIPRLKSQMGLGSSSSNKDDIVPDIGGELGKNIDMPSTSFTDIDNEPLTATTAKSTNSPYHAGPSKATDAVDGISPAEMEEGLTRDNDKGGKLAQIWNRLPLKKIIPAIKKKFGIGSSSDHDDSDDTEEDTENLRDKASDSNKGLGKSTFVPTSSEKSQEARQKSPNGESPDTREEDSGVNHEPDTSNRDETSASSLKGLLPESAKKLGGLVPDKVMDSIDKLSPHSVGDSLKGVVPKGAQDFLKDRVPKGAQDSLKDLVPKGAQDSLKGLVPKGAQDSLKDLLPDSVGDSLKGLASKGAQDSLKGLAPKGLGDSLKGLVPGGGGNSEPNESQKLSDAMDLGTDC